MIKLQWHIYIKNIVNKQKEIIVNFLFFGGNMANLNFVGYIAMYVVGIVLMFVISFVTYKKHELKFRQALLFTLLAFAGGMAGTKLMGMIQTAVLHAAGFSDSSGMSIYGAVIFVPIIVIPLCLLFKQPWKPIMDLLAPSGITLVGCAKLGCLFLGCCPGIECSFGIYYQNYKRTMFPSPIFEFITILLIVIIGFWYIYKNKNRTVGTVYPLLCMLYGSTRFLWEFLRYYDPAEAKHIILGMSLWQFVSILVTLAGAVWFTALQPEWLHTIKNRFTQPQKGKQNKTRKK